MPLTLDVLIDWCIDFPRHLLQMAFCMHTTQKGAIIHPVHTVSCTYGPVWIERQSAKQETFNYNKAEIQSNVKILHTLYTNLLDKISKLVTVEQGRAARHPTNSSDFKGVKISKYEQALSFMHYMNTCQIQMLSTITALKLMHKVSHVVLK